MQKNKQFMLLKKSVKRYIKIKLLLTSFDYYYDTNGNHNNNKKCLTVNINDMPQWNENKPRSLLQNSEIKIYHVLKSAPPIQGFMKNFFINSGSNIRIIKETTSLKQIFFVYTFKGI